MIRCFRDSHEDSYRPPNRFLSHLSTHSLIMLQDSESCHHATYIYDNYYVPTMHCTCTWNTHDHDPLLPTRPASLATSTTTPSALNNPFFLDIDIDIDDEGPVGIIFNLLLRGTETSIVESGETCGNAGKQPQTSGSHTAMHGHANPTAKINTASWHHGCQALKEPELASLESALRLGSVIPQPEPTLQHNGQRFWRV
ncbi:hypothetical protein Pelo_17572 [Pelomyxa schiedti]|nr:hypothetical protein Pelo_17572 [Pelomyxa schiedti]